MSPNNAACTQASTNLRRQINANSRFPSNVFGQGWGSFHFFDSDWMFDAGFVEHVKSLLNVEGSVCGCLVNLDVATDMQGGRDAFYIEHGTEASTYLSLLRGATPGAGWVHKIDRFGCTSDIGEWSMYCERASEIAVIAIHRQVAIERYIRHLEMFKAVPLARAFEEPLAYGFTSMAISHAWRDKLLAEYAARPDQSLRN
jgi:hypothetical protein